MSCYIEVVWKYFTNLDLNSYHSCLQYWQTIMWAIFLWEDLNYGNTALRTNYMWWWDCAICGLKKVTDVQWMSNALVIRVPLHASSSAYSIGEQEDDRKLKVPSHVLYLHTCTYICTYTFVVTPSHICTYLICTCTPQFKKCGLAASCKTWNLADVFCFENQNGSWDGEQWINLLFYLSSFLNYFCKHIECQAAVDNMLCLQCLSERRMTLNLKILQEQKKMSTKLLCNIYLLLYFICRYAYTYIYIN